MSFTGISQLVKSFYYQILTHRRANTWLFRGTQGPGLGKVDVLRAEHIRQRLDTQRVKGISFNPDTISDFIFGGTCSAMALEFIHEYFKRAHFEKSLKERLNHVIRMGDQFATSSEERRARQMAYNTIEVVKVNETVDYCRNKIQSLANDFFLQINYASKKMNLIEDQKNKITDTVEKLPDGVFLVRVLKPASSKKLEIHGHSMVYIKENGVCLFYDPNQGVKYYLADSNHAETTFEFLQNTLQPFGCSEARFYRLSPDINKYDSI